MDLRKLYIASMSVIAAFSLISCKDDEEDTASLPYVDNTPAFTLDRYIKAGSTHTMNAATVTNATGADVSYSWSVTRGSDTVDGDDLDSDRQEFTFKFSGSSGQDTLCNFTVTCSASATGYYGTSHSVTTTTVNDESIKYDLPRTPGKCSDGRRTYNTVKIDGLEWMAENIAYKGSGDNETGAALENSDAVSDIFGRFYTWDEAKAICANIVSDGGNEWRLPSWSDWDALGKHFAASYETGEGDGISDGASGDLTVWKGITGKLMAKDLSFNGDEMWEYWPAVGEPTNESGFSVIPTGYATVLDRGEGQSKIWTFFGLNEYAGFWTSDEYRGGTGSVDTGDGNTGTDEGGTDTGSDGTDAHGAAYYVYMYDTRPDLLLNYTSGKSFALPVRCVRNAQ